MKHTCKKEFIVLSGPFRRFASSTEAAEAAKTDTLTTGTDHAVIAVDLSRCDQEVAPQNTSDLELLRQENAKLREEFNQFKADHKGKNGKTK